MNKKLRTRILLFVVAGIWGYNIYRTYSNYQTEQTLEENEQVYKQPQFSPMMFNKDSFELELPVVDPFLRKPGRWKPGNSKPAITQSNFRTKSNKSKKTMPLPPVQRRPWPQIKYLGFVKNRSKEAALCLIQINGSMIRVSKGDEATGVYVSNVFTDSIHLVYSGEERTFVKG